MANIVHKITPHLWYDKEAKEAAEYYVKVFNENPYDAEKEESRIVSVSVIKDTPGGDCDYVEFILAGQEFMAISAGPMFKFSAATSFAISCSTQEEIDYFWERMSAVPEVEACGWCKDKFGLTWIVWCPELGEMEKTGSAEQVRRLHTTMWQMKKLDLAALRKAFEG